MQLYFIRHGQSANNLLWDQTQANKGRSADPELTEYGRLQADHVARFLAQHNGPPPATQEAGLQNTQEAGLQNTQEAGLQNVNRFGITHVYASLMVRAMDTASAIAKALNLTPMVWEGVHEGGGIWFEDEVTGERTGLPGGNRAFFEARYPNFILPDRLNGAGWWNRPFEPRSEHLVRAKCFLETLQERHGGTEDRVAVVSHGAFYNYMLKTLLNIPDLLPIWFAFNNAAITRVDFGADEVRLAYQNRVDFLPQALVT